MRQGFILLLVIIATGGVIIYLVLISRFSTLPNKLTQDTAGAIPKYNNTKTWAIENSQTICLLNYNDCANPPSKIKFSSTDDWQTIYQVYRKDMLKNGWQTRSAIITTIPTSIVFTTNECQATLEEGKNTNFVDKSEGIHQYMFTIICR